MLEGINSVFVMVSLPARVISTIRTYLSYSILNSGRGTTGGENGVGNINTEDEMKIMRTRSWSKAILIVLAIEERFIFEALNPQRPLGS